MDTTQLFSLLVVALACAGLILLLEISLQAGHIFGAWLPWLAGKLVKPDELFQRQLNAAKDAHVRADLLIARAWQDNRWFKPLGGCIYCMGFHIANLAFLAGFFALGWPLWYGLLFTPCTTYLLRLSRGA